MQIPTLFYGSQKEVKSRCRKIVKQLAAGATWQEAINVKSTVDMANTAAQSHPI